MLNWPRCLVEKAGIAVVRNQAQRLVDYEAVRLRAWWHC